MGGDVAAFDPRKVALFKECSDKFVQDLIKGMHPEQVPAGRVICKEGERGDKMYFIQTGELAVEIKGTRVFTLKDGMHFGEMALLGGKHNFRTATITADTECDLRAIDAEWFTHVLSGNPKEAALLKAEALARQGNLKAIRQQQLMSRMLGGTIEGHQELKPEGEEALKECFDAHAKNGKISLRDDDAAGLAITRDGDQVFRTLNAFGLTRFRPGGKMGAGQGLLDREIQDLVDQCDQKALDFVEAKTLAAREPFLAQEWKAYKDDPTRPGYDDAGGSDIDPLDPVWQIQESFKVLVNSFGDSEGIDTQMLYSVLSGCGEEIDNEDFDEFLQIAGLPNSGKIDVKQVVDTLKHYAEDEYAAGADKENQSRRGSKD